MLIVQQCQRTPFTCADGKHLKESAEQTKHRGIVPAALALEALEPVVMLTQQANRF